MDKEIHKPSRLSGKGEKTDQSLSTPPVIGPGTATELLGFFLPGFVTEVRHQGRKKEIVITSRKQPLF